MKPKPRHAPDGCRAVAELLDRTGDKWSVGVVRHLSVRMMRFTELRRSLDGISRKMLTSTLRTLERDGYVARTVIPSVPPRVEYELTDLGLNLWQRVAALGEWARANHARVQEARAAFDARREPQR